MWPVGFPSSVLKTSEASFVSPIDNSGAESIDGSILEDIEPKDLEDELKIKSPNTRKRLMVWIREGLREFTKFL